MITVRSFWGDGPDVSITDGAGIIDLRTHDADLVWHALCRVTAETPYNLEERVAVPTSDGEVSAIFNPCIGLRVLLEDQEVLAEDGEIPALLSQLREAVLLNNVHDAEYQAYVYRESLAKAVALMRKTGGEYVKSWDWEEIACVGCDALVEYEYYGTGYAEKRDVTKHLPDCAWEQFMHSPCVLEILQESGDGG